MCENWNQEGPKFMSTARWSWVRIRLGFIVNEDYCAVYSSVQSVWLLSILRLGEIACILYNRANDCGIEVIISAFRFASVGLRLTLNSNSSLNVSLRNAGLEYSIPIYCLYRIVLLYSASVLVLNLTQRCHALITACHDVATYQLRRALILWVYRM